MVFRLHAISLRHTEYQDYVFLISDGIGWNYSKGIRSMKVQFSKINVMWFNGWFSWVQESVWVVLQSFGGAHQHRGPAFGVRVQRI